MGKDAINSIGWDAIPKAGNRIMNATVGAIGDILDNDKPAKLENHNATECPFPTWIGDGVCDNDILIPACDYDGGDCDTKYPDCYKAKLIGNGECDEGNLEPECDFDGGDCCEPDWYKDDYCDQRNNNEICEWDGGDCTPTGGSYS